MPDELLTELIDVKLPEIIGEALTVDLAPLISELRLSDGQQGKLADEARGQHEQVLRRTSREIDELRGALAAQFAHRQKRPGYTLRRGSSRRPGPTGVYPEESVEGLPDGPPERVHRQLTSGMTRREWRVAASGHGLRIEQAYARWWAAAKELVVLPFLRLRLGKLSDPGFSRTFAIFDWEGLNQVRARQYLIPLESMQRLGGMLEDIDGGTVVIAGPRGGGKTTLIEAIIGEQWSTDPRHGVVLFEEAPVEYQPREFALHLYARLCQQVIAAAEPRAAPAEPPSRIRLLRWANERRASLAAAAAGLAAVLIVLALTDTARPAALVGLGVLLFMFGGIVAALPRSIHAGPPAHNAEPQPVDWTSLADQAKRRLAQIRFQQRWTVGWTGSLTAAGMSGSHTRTADMALQTMTHPEVVHAFRDFLVRTAGVLVQIVGSRPPPLIVAIDELDRLPPTKASQFVAEIKGMLSAPIPGCLYLLTVSDETLLSFDEYGSESREALGNAFDAVIRVEQLGLPESSALLRARVVGVPDPFRWLCHCLSGGRPRELIRIARLMVEFGRRDRVGYSPGSTSLRTVAEQLVAHELTRQPTLLDTALGLVTDHVSSPLLAFLDMRRLSTVCARDLLALAASIDAEPTPQGSKDEVLAYLSFFGTVLETFDGTVSDENLIEARRSRSLERLAAARTLIRSHPSTAQAVVTDFRRRWRLPASEPGHA